MAEVRLEGVSKRFGDVVALDALDLHATDDDFLVLLGPSGCGKSTALRCIAGLEEPSEGRVLIGDRDVTHAEPKDRDVAMVFQSYALYPHKTVRQNIEFPLVPRDVPKDERRRASDEAAALLGLSELMDRKPRALSGGQRQRVALARAIVRRPAAFLMDEPLSNLDAKLRTQTRAELVELHQRVATTFVYVTHDQVEAMTMATKVAILADGRLQQVGAPHDVYAKPANRFVATFIGSPPMNVLDGELGQSEVAVAGGRLLVPRDLAAAADRLPSDGIAVGVRPEHLTVRPASHAPDAGLVGRVRVVESLGHEHLVLVDVAGETVIARQSGDGTPPAPGTDVVLVADPERVHLFDPDSGRRIDP